MSFSYPMSALAYCKVSAFLGLVIDQTDHKGQRTNRPINMRTTVTSPAPFKVEVTAVRLLSLEADATSRSQKKIKRHQTDLIDPLEVQLENHRRPKGTLNNW